jgi:putative membrane protein
MTLARWLLIAHAAAVLFALGGLLVALPHPELWAGSASASAVFSFGMTYAGSLHIVLGAAAVFAFGVAALGWRRTLIFFVAATAISLGSELIGTGTGWPFGAYEYTEGLGPKVLGRVPFSIPLSWFYVGLACYLLARLVVGVVSAAPRAWWSVALGAWFLVVWDLVLDPAMAHDSLAVRFWVWHQSGPYFGMPIQNFVGWAATALVFMGLSRLLWGADPDPARIPAWFPLAIYAINLAFAIALSASVGLWPPILLALVLGLLPATLAWRRSPGRSLRTSAAT